MEIIESGTINYEVEIIFPLGKAPISYHSFKLWQKIIKYNTPNKIKYAFSDHYLMIEEINNDYNFKSLSKVILEKNKPNIYSKKYFIFDFYFTEKINRAVSEKLDIPHIVFTNENKIILGHICKKATLESASKKLIVWYNDLIKTNFTLADCLPQIAGIEGIIFELEEIPIANEVFFYKKYQAISFSQNIKKSNFKLPPNYIQYENIEAVKRVTFKQLRVKSLNKIPTEKSKIIEGKWGFKSGTDKVTLEFKKTKNGHFDFIRKCWQENSNNEAYLEKNKAFISDNYIVVGTRSDFYLLKMSFNKKNWYLFENELFSFKKL